MCSILSISLGPDKKQGTGNVCCEDFNKGMLKRENQLQPTALARLGNKESPKRDGTHGLPGEAEIEEIYQVDGGLAGMGA